MSLDFDAIQKDLHAELPDGEISRRHNISPGHLRRLKMRWDLLKATTEAANRKEQEARQRGYDTTLLQMSLQSQADVLRTHKEIISWMVLRLEWLQCQIDKGAGMFLEEMRQLKSMVNTASELMDMERRTYAMPTDYTDAVARAASNERRVRPATEILRRPGRDHQLPSEKVHGSSRSGAVH